MTSSETQTGKTFSSSSLGFRPRSIHPTTARRGTHARPTSSSKSSRTNPVCEAGVLCPHSIEASAPCPITALRSDWARVPPASSPKPALRNTERKGTLRAHRELRPSFLSGKSEKAPYNKSTCTYCSKKGHTSNVCRKKMFDQESESKEKHHMGGAQVLVLTGDESD
jgi:hypothetical protein